MIYLVSPSAELNQLAEDYTFSIMLNAFDNPQAMESFIKTNQLTSGFNLNFLFLFLDTYYLIASFQKDYRIELTSFTQPLFALDPIQFHCPIQFLAAFFQFVEPPKLQLVNDHSQFHSTI